MINDEFGQDELNFDDIEKKVVLNIVDNSIEDEYYKSGIYQLLQENDPELFLILVRQVIPKRKQQILHIYHHIKTEAKLESLFEELKNIEKSIKQKSAALQPWDREDNWIFWNKVLEWTLKAGLAVVPILSMFSMIGLTRLDDLGSNWGIAPSFSIIASILLVWATSASIYNWVISEDENTDSKDKIITLLQIPYKASDKEWKLASWKVNKFRLLIIIVWLAEALLGFATIPPLIENSRIGTNSPELNPLEKFEILVGTSIFAFVNIWFSVARGRVYRINTPKRIELGEENGKKVGIQERINQCQQRIRELEVKIKNLEVEILSCKNGTTEFNNKFTDLSDILTRGRNYTKDKPLIDKEEQNQSEGGEK